MRRLGVAEAVCGSGQPAFLSITEAGVVNGSRCLTRGSGGGLVTAIAVEGDQFPRRFDKRETISTMTDEACCQ